MAKKLSKENNINNWKKGINNIKEINNSNYARNKRGGIRL